MIEIYLILLKYLFFDWIKEFSVFEFINIEYF